LQRRDFAATECGLPAEQHNQVGIVAALLRRRDQPIELVAVVK